MRNLLFLLIILSASANCMGSTQATEITKKFSVAPLKMTYEDAGLIISNLQEFLTRVNSGARDDILKEEIRIEISAGEDTISLSGWKPLTEIHGMPKVGRTLRFSYRNSNAPISRLEMTLTDSYREIEVTGTEDAQVQAISSLLKERLSQHETIFSGSLLRTLGGVAFMIIAAALFNLGGMVESNKHTRSFFLAGFMLIAIIFLPPWNSWLPGVAIYSGSASFIDRNINLMSFAALLVSILVPVVRYARRAKAQLASSPP